MLTPRAPHLVASAALLLVGCSTALYAESQYDDEWEPDASAPIDSGPIVDARAPVDAGRDAAIDAGRDARIDAGRDGGTSLNCPAALPGPGLASLLVGGCSSRAAQPCGGRNDLDAVLDRAARTCLMRDSRAVRLAVTLNAAGCPEYFYYDTAFGETGASLCVQSEIEELRFACGQACSVLQLPKR